MSSKGLDIHQKNSTKKCEGWLKTNTHFNILRQVLSTLALTMSPGANFCNTLELSSSSTAVVILLLLSQDRNKRQKKEILTSKAQMGHFFCTELDNKVKRTIFGGGKRKTAEEVLKMDVWHSLKNCSINVWHCYFIVSLIAFEQQS